ncbi:heavy-metal-associated domain protein, partial [Vibrio parahaemolyticus V-223/04]|jgi:hypothetical protein
VPK